VDFRREAPCGAARLKLFCVGYCCGGFEVPVSG
jgi:hypothetical protein